jgi:hypothetical protein
MNLDQIHYVPPSVEPSYYATLATHEIFEIALETLEYAKKIGSGVGLEAAEQIFAIAEAKDASEKNEGR